MSASHLCQNSRSFQKVANFHVIVCFTNIDVPNWPKLSGLKGEVNELNDRRSENQGIQKDNNEMDGCKQCEVQQNIQRVETKGKHGQEGRQWQKVEQIDGMLRESE
jgi:hypothetical protein